MLNRFICSLSNNDDHHYITKKPIKLECKHYICHKCYKKHGYDEFICCVRCGFCCLKASNLDSSNESDNDFMNLLDQNLNNIKTEIMSQFNKTFSALRDRKETVIAKLEYLKDEIDIKVDSLKVELDQQAANLKRDLERKKKAYCYELLDPHIFDSESDPIDDDNDMSDTMQWETDQIQKTIASIRKSIKDLETQFDYRFNDNHLSSNIILDKIKEEYISRCPNFLQFAIRDFAVMPNGMFCVIQDNTIAVYNKQFCEIAYKITKRINFSDKRLKLDECNFVGVVSDDVNNLYVIDVGNKCIIKFNLKLEIMQFCTLAEPYGGIFYCNSYLYVTHQDDILSKWTTDLEIVCSHQVYGTRFGFLNNTLCSVDTMLHFYKLEPFEYMFSYNLKNDEISLFVLNDEFFVQLFDQRFAYTFNDKGQLLKQVDSKHAKLVYSKGIEKIIEYDDKYFVKVYENDRRAIGNSYALMLV